MSKPTSCPTSHDNKHHFPINVQTGIERADCIYCGKTKAQILTRATIAVAIAGRKRGGRIEPMERPPTINDL